MLSVEAEVALEFIRSASNRGCIGLCGVHAVADHLRGRFGRSFYRSVWPYVQEIHEAGLVPPDRLRVLSVLRWGVMRDRVWREKGSDCHYCGVAMHPGRDRTIDHVIPPVAGGTDAFANLVPCCRSCNSLKGRQVAEFARALEGGGG